MQKNFLIAALAALIIAAPVTSHAFVNGTTYRNYNYTPGSPSSKIKTKIIPAGAKKAGTASNKSASTAINSHFVSQTVPLPIAASKAGVTVQ